VRIVSETKRPRRVRDRPQGTRPHPWEGAASPPTALYMGRAIASTVEAELKEAANVGVEAMGLLLGDQFEDAAGKVYSLAAAAVTAPQQATGTHVRWAPDAMADLAGELDAANFDFVIVGFYHSHLRAACVPSTIDLDNQRRYFASPHQVSWILDPLGEVAAAYRLEGGRPVRRPVELLAGGAKDLEAYLIPKRAPVPAAKRSSYTPR